MEAEISLSSSSWESKIAVRLLVLLVVMLVAADASLAGINDAAAAMVLPLLLPFSLQPLSV